MKKILTLFLSVLLGAALPAFAQKDFRSGYIVTLRQDTLRGLVNYKSDSRNALGCTFKSTEEAPEQEFDPTSLAGFGFTGGKVYESKKAKIVSREISFGNTFPEELIKGHINQNFMEVLIRGKMNLYYLSDTEGRPHFYIQKDAEGLQELVQLEGYITNPQTGSREFYRSKQYVGILTLAFADCPDPGLKKQVEQTELKLKALQKVATYYNNCSSGKILTTNPKPNQGVKCGLMAGLSRNAMLLRAGNAFLVDQNFNGNSSFIGGGFIAFPLFRQNEKLWLHNTVLLTHKTFASKFSETRPNNYNVNYDFNIDLTYLGINPQLRYTLPLRTVKPYAGAGFSANLLLDYGQRVDIIVYQNGNLDKTYQNYELFDKFRTFEFALNTSIGVKYPVSSNQNVFLECRLESGNGFSPYSTNLIRTSSISFLTGVEF